MFIISFFARVPIFNTYHSTPNYFVRSIVDTRYEVTSDYVDEDEDGGFHSC